MSLTSGELERIRLRKRSEVTIADFTVCHYCKSTGLKETDMFCPNCGFPQRGTQGQMKKFLWNISNRKKLLEEHRKAVNGARDVLYLLAGLNLLIGLGFGIFNNDIPTLIGGLLSAGIYFALGRWSRKQPFIALLSGFFVYIVFIVIAAIDDPSSILRGMLFKILFIGAFIYGYKGAKESKRLEAELESIKKAKDLSDRNELPQV